MKLLLRHACALMLMLGFAASAQTIPGSTPPAGETSTTTHVVRYKGVIAAPQGVVNLTFSLYSAETGGTAVWSETQNVTIDNAGNFSALIGAGTTGGLPEAIFLNESAMWLGVAVTGQAENSRVLLVSVPYAMSAVEAERLGGHAASDFVLQSQLAAGGTTSGGTGTTTSGGTAPTVSGTSGHISKFSAPDSLDDSLIYQDTSGRIGIFTDTVATDPADDTKIKIAGRLRVQVANNPSSDGTSSAATFTNEVNASVDQTTATHQSFISNVTLYGTKFVNASNGGLFETDDLGSGGRNQILGSSSIAYVGGASTTQKLVASYNDVSHDLGTVTNMAAVRAGGATTFGPGSTTNQMGLWVEANSNQSGDPSKVTNNYGVLVADQDGVGTSNWAIKTGTGLVDFGDKTQFAIATANRASLNIPLGSAPTSPQEGDVWNEGGAIKFVSGGTTKVLATTADLAGVPTSSDLSALQTAINNEASARAAADSALTTALNNETSARQAADATLQSNIDAANASVTTEATARAAADTTLQTNINTVSSNLTAETTARTAADTTLQSNIDAANAAITAETTARTAADTALQSNINTVASNLTAETTARQAADTTLQTNITNEASARTAADTTLQSNIDAANTAVTNETSARTAADTTLQNNINSEATTRATTDTTLQGNIAAEAATRASADTALSNSITSLQNSLTTLDSGSAKLAGNNTFTGANDFSGASSTAPVKVVTIATTPSTCVANKELILKSDAPTGQQLFLCNSGGNGYNLLGGSTNGTVTNIATGSGLTGGPITSTGTISIATGGVTNAMLANSGVTVTAGTGLSGGGAVSLGGTITLNNTGALSFNGRTGAITPAANDYSFAQVSGTAGASQGGTGVTSSGAAGNFLRSNGTTWASSAIQASDLPSLSTTYVDLSSAQTISGAKTFSSGITGTITNSLALNGKADTAFEQVVNKNAASGYAGLDATSRIAKAQAPSTTVYTDASNTFSTGTQDFSAATKTLPVKSVTIATTPASCTTSKELIIKTDAPAGQQLFICNATGNGYVLVGDGSGTVTSITTGSGLTGGPITTSGTISIATGGVTNAMLANSSVTVTAGTGMTGGGSVALGGSVTVNNNGVLSFNGRNGAVTPAANDYSFSQISGTAATAQGGTGITSSGATGNVLRSNGTTWASSAIQASDLPSLSSTYVDLSSAQTIAGTKTFSSTISGNISGTASNVTGTVATANGGTGLTSAGASGNILVSNGTTWTSSAPTILSGNYVDLTTNQSIAGTKTFTGVVDHSVATQTLPVRAVTVATMGTSCTANKEMIVVTDGQPGRQLWLCNSTGNGWNLLGDGIGGNGVTFNAVNVPTNSLLLTKNTCSATYTGTYPTVVAGQDIPIPPATGTLTQQSTLVVSPISSMSNSMPAGWTSYQYYAYVDASNQAFLHVCNPTQNNISTLSGGSGAITFNVRAIN